MRDTLEKRLYYLFTGESVSFIGFILFSFLLNRSFPELRLYSLFSFWFSFFILEFLLAQGAIYWHSKWQRLKKENCSITPIQIVKRFKRIQKWNVGLIATGVIPFILDFLKWHSALPVGGLRLAVFIYLFSILEYINYFHIQLSYDNFSDLRYLKKIKKLKKASLRRDFERLKEK
nr:general stress protein [uncultured Bacillus sp.]